MLARAVKVLKTLAAILSGSLAILACNGPTPRAPVVERPLPDLTRRSLTLPDENPIWEVYARLECRGSTYTQCFHPRGTCEQDQSAAHIVVDFAAEHVAWIDSQDADGQRIVGRTFRAGWSYETGHIEPESAVYLSDPGTVVNFGGRSIDEEEAQPSNESSLPATLTHTDGYETFVHRMRCIPAQ